MELTIAQKNEKNKATALRSIAEQFKRFNNLYDERTRLLRQSTTEDPSFNNSLNKLFGH